MSRGPRQQRAAVLRIALLVLTSLLAGAILALASLPLTGTLALVARHEAAGFNQLPCDLVEVPLDQRTTVLDDRGLTLAVFHGTEDRVNVTIDQVPTVMQQAIVAIEDSRFYQHDGVDLRGTVRALVRNNQAGETVQGGSTITQQYVKQVLLYGATTDAAREAATAKTAQRKAREAKCALDLERRLSKQQILERYLNIAYFGEGVYGIGQAAQHYFHEPVTRLTLPQAALLAGLVNSPTAFDPVAHPQASTERRTAVLTAMHDQMMISASQVADAEALPLLPTGYHPNAVGNADSCTGSVAPWVCAYVRDELLSDTALGTTAQDRERKVFSGGLVVRTTLDMTKQRALQAAVSAVVPANPDVAAMGASVEPGTGHILALAVNRPYGTPSKQEPLRTKVDYAVQPQLQAGSSFKVFTLTTAIKQGLPLRTTFASPVCYPSKIFDNPQPAGCYHNAGDSEAGLFDLVNATWYSVNTYFVQLEEEVGVLAAKQTALDMGIPAARFINANGVDEVNDRTGSFTLGSAPDGYAPLDLANAYATLAARGVACQPVAITSIGLLGSAARLPAPSAKCRQVLDPSVADTVTSVLEGVLSEPQATAVGKALPDRASAGKTGTTNNDAAAWFTGYTPALSTSIAMGHFSSYQPGGTMATLDGYLGVPHMYGGTLPAQIWQQSMTESLAGTPAQTLPPLALPHPGLFGDPVPGVVGLTVGQATAALTGAGFQVSVDPTPVPADTRPGTLVPAGSVVSSYPAGRAARGSTITLRLSNGVAASPPPASTPPPGTVPPAPAPGQPAPGQPAPGAPTTTSAPAPAPTTAAPAPPAQPPPAQPLPSQKAPPPGKHGP